MATGQTLFPLAELYFLITLYNFPISSGYTSSISRGGELTPEEKTKTKKHTAVPVKYGLTGSKIYS